MHIEICGKHIRIWYDRSKMYLLGILRSWGAGTLTIRRFDGAVLTLWFAGDTLWAETWELAEDTVEYYLPADCQWLRLMGGTA